MKKIKTEGPGPGEYSYSTKHFGKTFYFTRAKRREKMNSTVGPGQYKLKPFIGFCDGVQREDKEILYVWFFAIS